jgi:hypothetical protein
MAPLTRRVPDELARATKRGGTRRDQHDRTVTHAADGFATAQQRAQNVRVDHLAKNRGGRGGEGRCSALVAAIGCPLAAVALALGLEAMREAVAAAEPT